MKKWANLPELRKRIAHMAQLAAIEEGLGDVVVEVHVEAPQGSKPRKIVVEVSSDPRDPKELGDILTAVRGYKWQDN